MKVCQYTIAKNKAMMEEKSREDKILKIITDKSKLKQHVYDNTLEVMKTFHGVLKAMALKYNEKLSADFDYNILKHKKINKFQSELKVGGDVLIFKMHSNVFEFDKDHGVWKISYVQNNKLSTYCGVINIYNFLADSFKYKRTEDYGYLVGRVFINKDKCYFVEGKRQMGFLFSDFGSAVIDENALKDIADTAIAYSLDFDLLVPPYDDAKIIKVDNILESRENSKLQTGKRLGFQFNYNDVDGKKSVYTGG